MSVFVWTQGVAGLKSRKFQGVGSRAPNANIVPDLFPRPGWNSGSVSSWGMNK